MPTKDKFYFWGEQKLIGYLGKFSKKFPRNILGIKDDKERRLEMREYVRKIETLINGDQVEPEPEETPTTVQKPQEETALSLGVKGRAEEVRILEQSQSLELPKQSPVEKIDEILSIGKSAIRELEKSSIEGLVEKVTPEPSIEKVVHSVSSEVQLPERRENFSKTQESGHVSFLTFEEVKKYLDRPIYGDWLHKMAYCAGLEPYGSNKDLLSLVVTWLNESFRPGAMTSIPKGFRSTILPDEVKKRIQEGIDGYRAEVEAFRNAQPVKDSPKSNDGGEIINLPDSVRLQENPPEDASTLTEILRGEGIFPKEEYEEIIRGMVPESEPNAKDISSKTIEVQDGVVQVHHHVYVPYKTEYGRIVYRSAGVLEWMDPDGFGVQLLVRILNDENMEEARWVDPKFVYLQKPEGESIEKDKQLVSDEDHHGGLVTQKDEAVEAQASSQTPELSEEATEFMDSDAKVEESLREQLPKQVTLSELALELDVSEYKIRKFLNLEDTSSEQLVGWEDQKEVRESVKAERGRKLPPTVETEVLEEDVSTVELPSKNVWKRRPNIVFWLIMLAVITLIFIMTVLIITDFDPSRLWFWFLFKISSI